jgi:hypothetical protein
MLWQPTIFCALGAGVHEGVYLAGGAVENSYLITMALHVQDQVFAHYGGADQADITIFPLRSHISKYGLSAWAA